MCRVLLLAFLGVWTSTILCINGEFDTVAFLTNFGYLQASPSHYNAPDDVKKAISDFQEFFSLPNTGHLDKRTVELMKRPRCGNVDVRKRQSQDPIDNIVITDQEKEVSADPNAPMNYSLIDRDFRWKKYDITWTLENTATNGDLTNRRTLELEVQKAFKVWSDITPLRFRKHNPRSRQQPDFHLSFARRAHKQDICGNNPFDGKGGVLAHAYPHYVEDYNTNGEVHFDDDDMWFKDRIDAEEHDMALWFHSVAAHEIGHALGLHHTGDPSALMFPAYGNHQVSEDDIRGIQDLYGPNPRGGPHPTGHWEEPTGETWGTPEPTTATTPTTPIPTRPSHAPHCHLKFDAVIQAHNGKFYAFSRGYTYEIEENGRDPRQIRNPYWDAPSRIDAAAYNPLERKAYIFSGSQYYRFTGFNLENGYPKPLGQDFRNLNAAYFKKRMIVVFKGNKLSYWSPQSNDIWRSRMTVPEQSPGFVDMDAIVKRREDGMIFSFKGKQMIKYNHQSPDAPGSSKDAVDVRPVWLNCNKPINSGK